MKNSRALQCFANSIVDYKVVVFWVEIVFWEIITTIMNFLVANLCRKKALSGNKYWAKNYTAEKVFLQFTVNQLLQGVAMFCKTFFVGFLNLICHIFSFF